MTKIYNPQGNQILKKSICCLILENNRENKLIIHMIEGENKENKGERKDCLSPNYTPSLKLPTRSTLLKLPSTKKRKSTEIFSHAPTIAKVA